MLSRTGLRSLCLQCRVSTSARSILHRNVTASNLLSKRSYSIQTDDIEKPLKPIPEASAPKVTTKKLEFSEEQWRTFQSQLEFPRATHEIAALTPANAGETVRLYGNLSGVHKVRRTLAFSRLSDGSVDGKTIQIVSDLSAPSAATEDIHKRFIKAQFGEPVVITGIVKPIENSTDGSVEIVLQEMLSLNSLDKKEIIRKDTNFPLSKRHLQLRYSPELHNALRVRAKVASMCRKQLEEEGFLEVETPILFKSTPEGAREFLVPTRRKAGYCYALPQSPQQYKQILMASGVKRYYQMARCFRDEDQRADRQPEFTQLDIELGFANSEDVIGVITRLIHKIWADGFNTPIPEIPRMTYQYAMNTYGSDKPDLRYPDVKIVETQSDETNRTEALTYPVPPSADAYDFQTSITTIPEITNLLQETPITITTTPTSITFTHTRPSLNTGGSTPLGIIRTHLLSHSPPPSGPVTKYAFTWITDFPLFTLEPSETDPTTTIIKSTHHPFTSPHPSDLPLLATSPLSVRGQHYDLVLNGVELGGGSARIHSRALQEYVLNFLNVNTDKFEHLLKVLDSGAPPHAGMALGFDRLMAVGLGLGSVRDVIAFPKTGEGKEELVGSPSFQGGEKGALGEYGLRVWKKGKE